MIEEFAKSISIDLLDELRETIIKVTGAPGTGKSTLCEDIAKALGVPRVPSLTREQSWVYDRAATAHERQFSIRHYTNDTFIGNERDFKKENLLELIQAQVQLKDPTFSEGMILLEGHRLQEEPQLREYASTSVHLCASKRTIVSRGRKEEMLHRYMQSRKDNPETAALYLSTDHPTPAL